MRENALPEGIVGFLRVPALLLGDTQEAEQLRTRIAARPKRIQRGDTLVIFLGAKVSQRQPVVRAFKLVLSENDVDGRVVWMKRDDRLELPGCLLLEILAPVNNPELSLRHPKRRIEREGSLQRFNRLLGLADQRERDPLPARSLRTPWSALLDEPKLLECVIVALLLKKLHPTLIGSVN